MVRYVRNSGILILLLTLCLHSASRKKDITSSAPYPVTFLDTINMGNEYQLPFAVTPGPSDTTNGGTGGLMSVSETSLSISSDNAQVLGYRIQCLASRQEESLEKEKERLEHLTDHPVYIRYMPPYYKMLVGDFVDRVEAREALYEIKGLGYEDAWVMRDTIQVVR